VRLAEVGDAGLHVPALERLAVEGGERLVERGLAGVDATELVPLLLRAPGPRVDLGQVLDVVPARALRVDRLCRCSRRLLDRPQLGAGSITRDGRLGNKLAFADRLVVGALEHGLPALEAGADEAARLQALDLAAREREPAGELAPPRSPRA
jgi:hypothetical protein